MEKHARVLFGTAAAFNLAVGGGLLFARAWLSALLKLDPIAGTNVVVANVAGAMIALFGIAYACVARDPVKYRPFIALGIAGKLMAVAGAVIPWSMGTVGATLPMLTGADVVFALLFADFWRRSRRTSLRYAPGPEPR